MGSPEPLSSSRPTLGSDGALDKIVTFSTSGNVAALASTECINCCKFKNRYKPGRAWISTKISEIYEISGNTFVFHGSTALHLKLSWFSWFYSLYFKKQVCGKRLTFKISNSL